MADPLPLRVVSRSTVRTGRYVLAGAEPSDARRRWYALHGYGQLAARFVRPLLPLLPADTGLVAPEGLSRFYADGPRPDGAHLQRVGATWMTREAREDDIADAVRWLDTVYGDTATAGTPVGVLAFSQGVATACRWIAHGSVRPTRFVVWAGGLAHDVDDGVMRERLAGTDVVLVAGTSDPFLDDERVAASLAQLRVWQSGSRVVRFDGDHRLAPDVLRALLPL